MIESQSLHSDSLTHARFSLASAHILHLSEGRRKYPLSLRVEPIALQTVVLLKIEVTFNYRLHSCLTYVVNYAKWLCTVTGPLTPPLASPVILRDTFLPLHVLNNWKTSFKRRNGLVWPRIQTRIIASSSFGNARGICINHLTCLEMLS